MIRFNYFGEPRELLVYVVGSRWVDGWEGSRFQSFLISEMRDVCPVGSFAL